MSHRSEIISNNSGILTSELDTPQGLTKVYEVEPLIESGETPILYVAGMGSGFKVVKGILNQFSNDNRKSIVAFPDRKGGKAKKQEIEVDYPQEVLRKAQALIAVLESKGFSKENKINAVGHSEGGLVLSAAVLINPEIFPHIVLIDPAGMVGKHSLLDLIKRQGRENKSMDSRLKKSKKHKSLLERILSPSGMNIEGTEIEKDVDATILERIIETNGDVFMGHIKESRFRALDELRAITQSEIHTALKIIHKKGIGVSIIQCTEDLVFPMDEFQREANQFIVPEEHDPKVFPKSPEGVDGIYTVKGPHNGILFNPKKYAKAVEVAITALEKKYEDK